MSIISLNLARDKVILAKLLSSFIEDKKWILIMDRTNWKFGKVHINILMLAVAHKGMSIPILWFLLPKDRKQENSNYRDRHPFFWHLSTKNLFKSS